MNGYKAGQSYLIDSNIFLRAFIRDDKKTWSDCVNALKAVGRRKFKAYIPTVIFAEVQFVLASFYGFKKDQVLDAVKSITSLPNLGFHDDCSPSLAIELFEMYSVKFIDCLLASSKLVQKGDAVILSYDRDFDKLGVRRIEPKDILYRVVE